MKLLSILKKYNKLSEPAKASIWFTFSSIIQRGISILSTPIFTRIMTKEEYGVYSVYQSWYGIISIFATLNLYAGVYNNGMTMFPEDRKRYTSSLQGLSTTITIVLFFVYLINIEFWNDFFELKSLYIFCMFIEILFVPAFSFWAASQRFDYKYTKLVVISICLALISPIIGVIAVLNTSYKTEARVLSYVCVQIVIGAFFYIYNMIRGRAFFIKKYWKFALSFNVPLIPHYLSQTILNQADRIMIGSMIGNGEAAIYSVAYTISMMMTIVTNAINNSFVPYTYKSLKGKNYLGLKKNTVLLVIVVAIACIIAMLLGPEIIYLIAAPEYYEARWIIPPVAAALFFMYLFPLFCNIEFFFEETKWIMIASCLASGLNVLLNYYFIGKFGYIAAAYTTLICYILLAVTHYFVHLFILKKHNVCERVYNYLFFLIISILLLGIMIIVTVIYDFALIRYLLLVILILIAIFKRNIFINIMEINKK